MYLHDAYSHAREGRSAIEFALFTDLSTPPASYKDCTPVMQWEQVGWLFVLMMTLICLKESRARKTQTNDEEIHFVDARRRRRRNSSERTNQYDERRVRKKTTTSPDRTNKRETL